MFNSRMNHLWTPCTFILTKTLHDSRASVSPSSTSGLTFPSSFNIICHRHLIFTLASPKTLLCTKLTLKIVFLESRARTRTKFSNQFLIVISYDLIGSFILTPITIRSVVSWTLWPALSIYKYISWEINYFWTCLS